MVYVTIAQSWFDRSYYHPDYWPVLRYYTEALEHARDFNSIALQQMLDYLTQLTHALAADGQTQVAAQMAGDFAQLAATLELPQTVIDTFNALKTELDSGRNE